MKFQNLLFFGLFGLALIVAVFAEVEEKVDVDEEKLDYAKGSLCGYCDYCKVCIFSYFIAHSVPQKCPINLLLLCDYRNENIRLLSLCNNST